MLAGSKRRPSPRSMCGQKRQSSGGTNVLSILISRCMCGRCMRPRLFDSIIGIGSSHQLNVGGEYSYPNRSHDDQNTQQGGFLVW